MSSKLFHLLLSFLVLVSCTQDDATTIMSSNNHNSEIVLDSTKDKLKVIVEETDENNESITTYYYNHYGFITKSEGAYESTVNFIYDSLNRIIKRETEGSTYTYEYFDDLVIFKWFVENDHSESVFMETHYELTDIGRVKSELQTIYYYDSVNHPKITFNWEGENLMRFSSDSISSNRIYDDNSGLIAYSHDLFTQGELNFEKTNLNGTANNPIKISTTRSNGQIFNGVIKYTYDSNHYPIEIKKYTSDSKLLVSYNLTYELLD